MNSNFRFRVSNFHPPTRVEGRAREFDIRHSKFEIFLLVAALLGPLACGKEALPQPPVLRVAERTTDLRAVQEGGEAVLRWSYPAMTTAGQSLSDVEAVEVWRATLPKAQEPPPPASAQDRQLQSQLLENQGEVIAVLDGEALGAATRGSELVLRDDLEAWRSELDRAAGPAVLWYGVRTICCRKRSSEMSNVARLLPVEPPPPPADVRLSAGDDGITLRWAPVPEIETLVERSPDGALWMTVTEEPVAGNSWNDTSAAQGRSWSYRLRSVAPVEGGGRVVGEASQPQRIDHPDTYPPPAPDELVCLPEGSLVRLRWTAVPGALEYEVSRRSTGDTPVVLATAVERHEFVDRAPPLGELVYLVAARDDVGNRSAPATCEVVMGAAP